MRKYAIALAVLALALLVGWALGTYTELVFFSDGWNIGFRGQLGSWGWLDGVGFLYFAG